MSINRVKNKLSSGAIISFVDCGRLSKKEGFVGEKNNEVKAGMETLRTRSVEPVILVIRRGDLFLNKVELRDPRFREIWSRWVSSLKKNTPIDGQANMTSP